LPFPFQHSADLPVGRSFVHNKAAVAGVAAAVAIITIALVAVLVVCILRKRSSGRFHRLRELEKTSGEVNNLAPSRINGGEGGTGVFSADTAYRRQERHWPSMNNGDSDSRSQYSETSSFGTFGQLPQSPGGSDEYSSSSYPTSTLPEYAERSVSASPPGYLDLSRSMSVETSSDVAERILAHDTAGGSMVAIPEERKVGS
jgi:hypothetical protein